MITVAPLPSVVLPLAVFMELLSFSTLGVSIEVLFDNNYIVVNVSTEYIISCSRILNGYL